MVMHRFLEARYSDADVLALYMKYREERIGPFVREIGDFIAHKKRNRGATLDRTAYMFSQVAFFRSTKAMISSLSIFLVSVPGG